MPWCKPVKFPHEDDALDHARTSLRTAGSSRMSSLGTTMGGTEVAIQGKLTEDLDNIIALDYDEQIIDVRCKRHVDARI